MEANLDDERPVRTAVRRFGDRRLASALIVGALALVTSVGGGALGAWIAMERSTLELGPPEALFANVFVVIGAMLVVAFGGIVGFLAAVTTLPPLVVWLLGWPQPLKTALTIVAIEIIAVPVVVLAGAWIADGPIDDAIIPVGIILLGGVVPALARWAVTGESADAAAPRGN